MKSLLDLQQEVRTLDKALTDIMDSLHSIHNDIDSMRNKDQTLDIDYAKVQLLASNIPFKRHPLNNQKDERICRLYFQLLLNVVRMDQSKEKLLNRFVFIQWMLSKSKTDVSLEDLYKESYKMKQEHILEFSTYASERYKESLITDTLIIAGIAGKANTRVYKYIAGLAEIFGIEKERLSSLARIAKVTLCQKVEKIPLNDIDDFMKTSDSFKYYVNELVKDHIISRRKIVVKLVADEVADFTWKVKQEQEVEEGQVIATYRKRLWKGSSSLRYQQKQIKAPKTGTIFQFQDKGIHYGVLAHRMDDKASIKAWVKEQQ